MNTRIKQFMEYKELSASELADSIGVQRSNLTHVLQGRNKPGFQFISKLLETYPEINAKWLITGSESMLVGEPAPKADLFNSITVEKNESSATEVNHSEPELEEKAPEMTVEPTEPEKTINNQPDYPDPVKSMLPPSSKEIERIVVFYKDQTFKQYLPSN